MSFVRFKALWIALQVAVFGIPVAGLIEQNARFSFPPLGDNRGLWWFIAMVVASTAGVLPYKLAIKGRLSNKLLSLFAIALIFGTTTLALEASYVVTITKTGEQPILVTRGSVRQAHLPSRYVSMSDENLIKHAGLGDDGLQAAYTSTSLFLNRFQIWLAYTGFVSSIEFLLGTLAVSQRS
ncbi:hypothetical protein [Terriglobus sp.]|uniref:hypothetical protein n=1 Tax=Terriglobus sp. TaxID=1889013 RepID=UPI003AFF9372